LTAVLHHGLNASTTALAAVAQDIETVQADVSEPGRMQMSTFVLGSQKFYRLRLCQAAATFGIMF
jgi:hypothetical protein